MSNPAAVKNLLSRPFALDGRYPRVARYLDGLPAGICSYQDCKARTSTYQAVLLAAPGPLPQPEEFAQPLRELLGGETRGLWISEVRLLAAILAIGDHFQLTPDRHYEWILEQNREMFSSIVYRALMAFLSPQGLLEKASERWGSFHQGTELHVEPNGARGAFAHLVFPAGLFDAELAHLYAAVFTAAAERARARNVQVILQDVTPTQALYRAVWI